MDVSTTVHAVVQIKMEQKERQDHRICEMISAKSSLCKCLRMMQNNDFDHEEIQEEYNNEISQFLNQS